MTNTTSPAQADTVAHSAPAQADTAQTTRLGDDFSPRTALTIKAASGYVATTWPNNPHGIGQMDLWDVTLYNVNDSGLCDLIPPHERLKFTRTVDGTLVRGDQIVGIETRAHYDARIKRMQADVHDAIAQYERDGAEIHYGSVRVVEAPLASEKTE